MMRTADDRSGWIGVITVIAIGAFLRFWHLSSGLPYRIGVDEPVIAEHALQIMKTGDFNPHFYDYPGLYIYVQVVVGIVRFLVGASNGLWHSLDQFLPDHLFLWTRALNAALGTVTVAAVYFVGLRWGRQVALLAAALMAVWPNHVRESHFALTDVPLTLLTIAAMLFSLRARETGSRYCLATAAAMVGLAAATKYNGAVALLMPLIAAVTIRTEPRTIGRNVLVVVAASGAAFLVGAPYTLLDLPGFLNSFAVLAGEYRPRPFTGGAAVYVGHLRTASGWPGVIVAAAGVAWAVFRAVRERGVTKWALLVVFPIAFFDFVATKNLIYGRYLLPLLPFLCVIMAIVLVDAVNWLIALRRPLWMRAAAATAVIVVTLVPVTAAGISWPREYGRKVTQDVAYRTIHEVVPAGSVIVVACPDLRLPANEYRARQTSNLTARSPEEYVSAGAAFLVASSDALERASTSRAGTAQAYQSLVEDPGRCLPPIQPTSTMSGPQIWICRLQSP